jgi:hypothetical protein
VIKLLLDSRRLTPCNGCRLGTPCLTRRTAARPHRRSTSSAALRPCRKAIRIMGFGTRKWAEPLLWTAREREWLLHV